MSKSYHLVAHGPSVLTFEAREPEKREPMPHAEISRLGGRAATAKLTAAEIAERGRTGGQVTKALYGREHYAAAGRKGGKARTARHTFEELSEMAAKGGRRTAESIAAGKRAEEAGE